MACLGRLAVEAWGHTDDEEPGEHMRRFIVLALVVCVVFGYFSFKHRRGGMIIGSLETEESQNQWRIVVNDGRISYLNLRDRYVQIVNTQPSGASRWMGPASISPDGRQIVFSELAEGQSYSLVAVDLLSRKRLVLFTLPFLDNPRWSPNGEVIAFEGRQKAEDGPSDLYLYVLRDHRAQPFIEHYLKSGFPLCWATDGTRIAYQSHEDNIEIIDLKTNRSSALDKGQFVSCSPDGRYLGYQTDNGGYIVRNLENDQKTSILSNGSANRSLIWSPDSRYIVYSKLSGGWWHRITGALSATDIYGDIYVMDIKSKSEVMIYRHSGSIYASDWGRISLQAL